MLSLGAVALLAGLAAIALVERRDATAVPTRGAIAPSSSGWYVALGAPRPPAGDAEKTTCGLILTARSLGVTHPVLPCGAKLLIRYGDTTVLTEVISNTLTSSGRQLELTDALAKLIGLDGTQELRWRYASRS
ncbi:MAG: hypothetical protein U0R50_04240 [Gaiellales bacterium]